MQGEVDIINHAFALIGQEYITSLQDNSAQGKAANTVFPTALDTFLSTYDWNFAKKKVALNELILSVDTAELIAPYTRCWLLPVDFVRLVELVGAEKTGTWTVSMVNDKRVICYDQGDVVIEYIGNDFSLSNMPGVIRTAFVVSLAMELDVVRHAGAHAQMLQAMAQQALQNAKLFDRTLMNAYRLTDTWNKVRYAE